MDDRVDQNVEQSTGTTHRLGYFAFSTEDHYAGSQIGEERRGAVDETTYRVLLDAQLYPFGKVVRTGTTAQQTTPIWYEWKLNIYTLLIINSTGSVGVPGRLQSSLNC
jgi:hypothetical protein